MKQKESLALHRLLRVDLRTLLFGRDLEKAKLRRRRILAEGEGTGILKAEPQTSFPGCQDFSFRTNKNV